MDNSILGYISVVNTAVWVIPLVVAVWMLIKKKFKIRHFVAGIFSYMPVYIAQQLLLIAVSLPFGKLAYENTAAAVAVYAIAIPPAAVFLVSFIYKRIIDDKNWYPTVGFGLGLGYATVVGELGMKLLSNMFTAIMITEGYVSELTGEQLEIYENAEKIMKNQTGSFYIYVGIAALMLFVSAIVNVLLIRKHDENGKKFPLLFAYILSVANSVLFAIAVYAAVESIAVILLMTALMVFDVYYLTKSYDAQDIETEYISRPSPLLGRNIDKRYKTKKKK